MIILGSDHAGFELKETIKKHLEQRGDEYKDLGAFSIDPVDFAVIAQKVCKEVLKCGDDLGLLFCGTGVGISIAANKVKGIRAACCSDYFSAKLTRIHNNANILCLGGRVVGTGLACSLIDVFIETKFCGEERHQRRIDQITQIENCNL
jgi:ribose 5-phosphate isomerase B